MPAIDFTSPWIRLFSHRSATLRQRMATGSFGSRGAQRAPRFDACVGSTTPQGLRRACDISLSAVLPSGSPDTVGASDFGYFGAHQLQGYPACICPRPTLWVRRYRRPHMARGQDGSLLLSCMTL